MSRRTRHAWRASALTCTSCWCASTWRTRQYLDDDWPWHPAQCYDVGLAQFCGQAEHALDAMITSQVGEICAQPVSVTWRTTGAGCLDR